MRYETNKNVTLRSVAGDYLLIAPGEPCPTVLEINRGAAWYWTKLSAGEDSESVLRRAAEAVGREAEELRPSFELLLARLETLGFLSARPSEE